ncbi:hypothetical protein LUW77_09410 [Streptomyces radiopugnans]|nr:hypothetical protein LUW77_09410 [Streptomyces radiopugnans]
MTALKTETYVHDANHNVVEQTIGGVTTTTTYDRNRLLKTTTNGVSATYNYDPLGRLDTVSSNGSVQEKYSYDGFDRIAKHTAEQRHRGQNHHLHLRRLRPHGDGDHLRHQRQDQGLHLPGHGRPGPARGGRGQGRQVLPVVALGPAAHPDQAPGRRHPGVLAVHLPPQG